MAERFSITIDRQPVDAWVLCENVCDELHTIWWEDTATGEIVTGVHSSYVRDNAMREALSDLLDNT
jgi:hypothetical protein